MRCEPCASVGPCAVIGLVDYARCAPYVSVVVGDPSGTSVHLAGCRAGIVGEVVDEGEERFVTFGEICHLGGPVVHLGVDVDGVFAVPRSIGFVIPYALEIGGLSARLRGGYEQIAAILEQEGGQLRVSLVGKLSDAFVGRHSKGLLVGVAERERHAGKLCAVAVDVLAACAVIGFLACGGQQRGGAS